MLRIEVTIRSRAESMKWGGRPVKRFVPIVILMVFVSLALADTDRGIELYRQGKYAEAQSELGKAVQADPEDARAQRYLGLALVEQHKAAEAREPLNQANRLDPGPESNLALARMHVELKELDKADEAMKEADGPDKDYVQGLIQLQRGQNQDAAATLEKYIKDNPEHAYAHYYAGMAYNAAKRPDKMLSHFELFVRLKPDAPEARKVRAVLSTGH
jgi:tetratricopeptide (TPR) repeat protein